MGIIMKHATFEVEYIIATLDPYSDSQTTRTASSIPTKLSQNSIERSNISLEDQQALESVNWDDLSMECELKRTKKNKKESFKELMNMASKIKQKPTERNKSSESEKIIPESPFLSDSRVESSLSDLGKIVFRRAMEQTFAMDQQEILVPNSDSE